MAYLQGLIEHSIELCEELETRSLEPGAVSARLEVGGGLYRDRYPCGRGEPRFLYDDGLPRTFADPKTEKDHWDAHIWSGYNDLIGSAESRGLRRQPSETRAEYRIRAERKVDRFYSEMQRTVRGLSYDLALLEANYIIARGLQGADAERAFQHQSATLTGKAEVFAQQSSRRLGLSYIKLKKRVDTAKPLQEVGEDLHHFVLAVATRQRSVSQVGSADQNQGSSRHGSQRSRGSVRRPGTRAIRAKTRCDWLNQKLSESPGWSSDTDIAANKGPTYNTIKRYRSGALSSRDPYVRMKLAEAFGCQMTDVPE